MIILPKTNRIVSSEEFFLFLKNHTTRSSDEDPMSNFDYFVEIDGFLSAYWQTADLPEGSAEIIKYREGGDSRTPRKFPGLIDWPDVACTRGVIVSRPGRKDSRNWFKLTHDAAQKDNRDAKNFRKNVEIGVFDREREVAERFTFEQAWCSKYKPGGSFDATASGISMESITITHEGCYDATE